MLLPGTLLLLSHEHEPRDFPPEPGQRSMSSTARRTGGGPWRWPGTMSSARSTIRNTDRGHRRKGICMTGDEGDHQRRVTVFLGNICLGRGPDSYLRNGCLSLPGAEIGYRHPSRLAGRVRVHVLCTLHVAPSTTRGFLLQQTPSLSTLGRRLLPAS